MLTTLGVEPLRSPLTAWPAGIAKQGLGPRNGWQPANHGP